MPSQIKILRIKISQLPKFFNNVLHLFMADKIAVSVDTGATVVQTKVMISNADKFQTSAEVKFSTK